MRRTPTAIRHRIRTEESDKASYQSEECIRDLSRNTLRMHEIPGRFSASRQSEMRRQALERKNGISLHHTGSFTFDAERAARFHCENLIGAVQIPVGVVGPLRIQGKEIGDDEVHVPLATTEGALVASTNRGARALSEAGGVSVRVENIGMTRAPVFRVDSLDAIDCFLAWIEANSDKIREVADRDSRFVRLLDVRPRVVGTTVFLRFRFDTADAMGMNGATIACSRVVEELIEPETGVECVSLSGNYCVDKKPAAVNVIEGRGYRIQAHTVLDPRTLSRRLKTTAEALVEVQYRKNLLGSIAAGSLGHNAHHANLVAAFFLATGQDPAQVTEGSLGITCIEDLGEGSVAASITMPDVPLAAVGGGTALDTQQEALALLGVRPDPKRPGAAARRCAEILGAVVLAGELSLLAALSSRDLARAHQKHARGS